jgi:outer membrane protein assembly factor BamB
MEHRRRLWLKACVAILSARAAAVGLAQGAADPPGPASVAGRDPIEGSWLGSIALPQGGTSLVGVRVARDSKGALIMFLLLPDIHVYGVPVARVERLAAGGYALDAVGSVVAVDGDRLRGGFAYPQLPLDMQRVDALPAIQAPADPDFPPGPDPRWTRTLGAAVWASPVTRDGTIYLGDVGGRVHALRARDGAPVWVHEHAVPIYGDALVTRGAVHVVDARMNLVCLSRADGTRRWVRSLDEARMSGDITDPTFNHRTPLPLLHDGAVYVGSSDRHVYVVDPRQGRVLRRYAAPGAVHGGIAISGGSLCYGTMGEDGVVAQDMATGALHWRLRTPQPVACRPVVDGGLLIVGSRDFILYGLDTRSGAVRWRNSFLFSWVESAPALRDGAAYVGSSDLRRVQAINAANGRHVWRTDVGGLSWGTPLATPRTIYAGTAGQRDVLIAHRPGICALDRATGAVRWRRPLATGPAPMSGIVSSLGYAGGMLLAAALDGSLTALPVTTTD